MTVQEMLYDVRALIDEYNEDGAIIAPADVATIEKNALRFINMAVQEIYAESRNYNTHIITNKSIKNLIGNGFEIVEFTGGDQYYPSTEAAKSYFFTVDSDATVYIQEYDGSDWNTIQTIVIETDEEVDTKGKITASDSSYPIRLVFSGDTYYRHLNRCLYPYSFKTVPDYKAYVRFDMPSDFGLLDEIIIDNEYYGIDVAYKWEGFKTLAINYSYEGTLKIIYKPFPTEITTATQTLEVNNPLALQFIRFFVASKLATTENTDLVSYFEGKAIEAKYDATRPQPASEEMITDVMYGGVYNGYV